jgi:hypothetical protein
MQKKIPLTPALIQSLASRHDPGQPPLVVETDALTVTRADGSPLSEAENRHIRGTLAAHAAEPLTRPLRTPRVG